VPFAFAVFECAESFEGDFLMGGNRVWNRSQWLNGSAAGNSALLDCECDWDCCGCGVLLVGVLEGDSIRYGESEPGVIEPPKPEFEFMVNGRDVRSNSECECTANELWRDFESMEWFVDSEGFAERQEFDVAKKLFVGCLLLERYKSGCENSKADESANSGSWLVFLLSCSHNAKGCADSLTIAGPDVVSTLALHGKFS
jgi:hypothetical protein